MKAESLQDLIAWTPPEQKWIIKHLLVPKARLIIFGQWGSFKSMLAIHTLFCVGTGRTWITSPTARCTVLLLQAEIPKIMHVERVLKYAKSHNLYPEGLWFMTEQDIKLDTPQGIAKLDSILTVVKPGLLIIDPIYRFLSGDITSNWQVDKLLSAIDSLANKHNFGTILISHTRKPVQMVDGQANTINWGHELIGASYFQDWTDSAMAVEPVPMVDTIRLHFTKHRLSEILLPQNMTMKFERSTLAWRII